MRIGQGLIAAVIVSCQLMLFPVYGAQTQEVIKTAELKQSYDEGSGVFIQMLDGKEGFSSTIPQDMITSGGVRFDHFTEELVYVLEKDGKALKYEEGQVITESGQYHLQLLLMPQINMEGMEEPSMEQLESEMFSLSNLQILDRDYTMAADFYFTIVEETVGRLNFVKAPKGYQIEEVRLDGQPLYTDIRGAGSQQEGSQSWCRIGADGTYEILFQPSVSGMPEYELYFVKDTQPPLLTLEGVQPDGTAKKSVRYESTEENCTVDVYREGRLMEGTSGEIRTPGLYRLVVQDQAGNRTSYLVQVKSSYPFVLLFLLLGGMAALAGGAYLVFRHQGITVR